MIDSLSGFVDLPRTGTTQLSEVLDQHRITDIYVCGLAYDYCVGSTACDGADLLYRTFVIDSLTAPVGDESAAAMDARLQGHGVSVIGVDDVDLSAWRQPTKRKTARRFYLRVAPPSIKSFGASSTASAPSQTSLKSALKSPSPSKRKGSFFNRKNSKSPPQSETLGSDLDELGSVGVEGSVRKHVSFAPSTSVEAIEAKHTESMDTEPQSPKRRKSFFRRSSTKVRFFSFRKHSA